MKNKLLNVLKNLIIIVTLVGIIWMLISTSVFAFVESTSEVTMADIMKARVSAFYTILRKVCFGALFIIFVCVLIKNLLFDNTPESISLFKSTVIHWVIGLILIFSIHYIMIAIVNLNEAGVEKARSLGNQLSGLEEGDKANSEEYSLYEQALSKAYELNVVAGNIGAFLYVLLVIYTYKFVFVYARRYINVIALIILSPILVIVSTLEKCFTGRNSRKLGVWFKEFIYNVCIQTVHATLYACTIGLTIKMMQTKETYAGAFLTMVLFAFIFKIDKYIRKMFNFVGGNVTVKRIDAFETFNKVRRMKEDYQGGKGALYEKKQQFEGVKNRFENLSKEDVLQGIGEASVKFQDSAVHMFSDAKSIISGSKVKVSSEEIAAQEEKLEDGNFFDKALATAQNITTGTIKEAKSLKTETIAIVSNVSKKSKEKLDELKFKTQRMMVELEQDVEMIKRIPIIIGSHTKKNVTKTINFINKHPKLQGIFQSVIDLSQDGKDLVEEMKNKIQNGAKDIVALVHNQVGPQAFLYPKVGSPFMGMKLLAENTYEKIFMREAKGEKKEKKTLKMPFLKSKGSNKSRKPKKAKKYSFNRFGSKATSNIINTLQKHTIKADNYLNSMHYAFNQVKIGRLKARGAVIPDDVLKRYKARSGSANTQKQLSVMKLEKFADRKEDGKWAKISSVMAEQALRNEKNLKLRLKNIQKMPDIQVTIENLTRRGKAYTLNKTVNMVFDKGTRAVVGKVAPAYNMMKSISNNVVSKADAVKSVVKDASEAAVIVKSIFKDKPETEMVNLIPQKTVDEHPNSEKLHAVGVINEDQIVQFVLSKTGTAVKQVLSLDGQVLEPAQDEEGNIIATQEGEGKVSQQIISMDGKVVEQTINLSPETGATVQVQDEYKEVETGISDLDSIIEDIKNTALENVSNNLDSVAENVEGARDVAQFTNEVNNIGIKDKDEFDERVAEFDRLIDKLAVANLMDVVTPKPLTEDEKKQEIADKILVDSAINTDIYNIENLNLEENETARLQVLDALIENGIVGTKVREDENAQKEIIEVMQSRVDELAENNKDVIVETVARNEYAAMVEKALASGEVTEDTIDDMSVDSKLDNLAEVIEKAARETLKDEEVARKKNKEQAKNERELEKARAERNKKNKKSKDNSESSEDEMTKVTLKFSGAVSTQFISVTLSNKDTISAFYDRAMPLAIANKAKTERYFNKMYKEKLGGIYYSFANYASENMDGWEIYVVGESEDIDGSDASRQDSEFMQREKAREEFEQKVKESMPKLKEVIGKFIEERKITDLQALKTDPKLKSDLVSKLLRELRRKNISRIQFTEFVERLDHYKEFKDLLEEIKDKSKAEANKEKAKELINSQKEKKTIIRTDEEIEVDKDSANVDRKIEENAARAEAENYNISKNSEEVLQDMFDSLNEAKVLTGGDSVKQQVRQKMYMDFYDNNQNDENK